MSLAGTRPGAYARATLSDPAFWGENAAPIGLVAVCSVFAVLTPDFRSWGNISDLLVSASILTVLALAQQCAIVVGGIDLSIAASLPFAAVIFGLTYTAGYGSTAAVAASLLAGAAVGLVNGLLITRLRINDFIVTLGMLGAMSGIALIVCGGQSFSVSSGFLRGLALGAVGPLRYFTLIALAAALLMHGMFFHTRFGTHVLATGGNREAARSMGIDIDRKRVAIYTLGGLLVGLAGILLVSRTGASDPSLLTSDLLSSIAAVVLGGASLSGGRAAIGGTVAGAILLTALLNGFTLLNVSEYYQPIAVGVVVIAASVLGRLQR